MMRNSTLKTIILLFITLTACTGSVSAQDAPANEKKSGESVAESFDIISTLKPKISDAVKIDVIPEKENISAAQKPDVAYKTQPIASTVKPVKSKLKSLSIDKSLLSELNHLYIGAGIGNYSNFALSAYYNSLRSKDQLITADALLNSGNGPLTNGQFLKSTIGLQGKKSLGKNAFSGGLRYSLLQNHFYGYNHDSESYTRDALKQSYSNFDVNGLYTYSSGDTGGIKASAGLQFYNFQDRYKSSENLFSIIGKASQSFSAGIASANLQLDIIGFSIPSYSVNRTIFRFDPRFAFSAYGITGYAGLKTAYEDPVQSQKSFHVYPDIYAEYPLSDNTISAFGLLSGGLQRNTFKSFALENNSIVSTPPLANTSNSIKVQLGLKGNVNSSFNYLAYLDYSSFKNFYYYLNSIADRKRFVPYFYSGATNIFRIHAEGGLELNEAFRLNGHINFYSYSVGTDPVIKNPYQLPNLDVLITGTYAFESKLKIGLELYGASKRQGKSLYNLENKERNIGGLFDMNLSSIYTVSKTLSVNLDLKNILNQKYELWNFYPVRGFQIFGGIKLNLL